MARALKLTAAMTGRIGTLALYAAAAASSIPVLKPNQAPPPLVRN